MTSSALAEGRDGLGRGHGALLRLAVLAAASAVKADPLLDEVVEFTGQVLYLETGVPGLIIAAVRGATHAGGLPREIPHAPGPDDASCGTITTRHSELAERASKQKGLR